MKEKQISPTSEELRFTFLLLFGLDQEGLVQGAIHKQRHHLLVVEDGVKYYLHIDVIKWEEAGVGGKVLEKSETSFMDGPLDGLKQNFARGPGR